MLSKKLAAGVLLGFMLVLFLILSAIAAHCSTRSTQTNTYGAVVYQDNPFSYLAGNVVDAFVIEDGKGLVLRVQPMGTYELFTEDILLCKVPAEKLEGHLNPVVLTYETVAHRAVDEVGCHELVRVDDIKTEEAHAN